MVSQPLRQDGFTIAAKLPKSVEDRQHFLYRFSKSVFYPRGHFLIIVPAGQPVIDYLAQAVSQHFWGYALQIPLQFVKPPRAHFQIAKDQQLPLSADQRYGSDCRAHRELFLGFHIRTPPF